MWLDLCGGLTRLGISAYLFVEGRIRHFLAAHMQILGRWQSQLGKDRMYVLYCHADELHASRCEELFVGS